MNDILKRVLKGLVNLGLSEKEARIYLASRKSHTANIYELAKKADVNRGNAYHYVSSLVQKGLLYEIEQDKKKYYSPCTEDGFGFLLGQEKSKTLGVKHLIDSFLTRVIQNISPLKGEGYKPEIRYYEGEEGIKVVYNEVLNHREVLSYINIEEILKAFPENLEKFQKMSKKHKIVLKEIIENSPTAKKYTEESKNRLYEARHLPSSIKVEMDYMIYGDYLTIINYKTNPPVSIIIKHKSIAETSRTFFQIVWNLLKK